jgi:hypothetical protein
MRKSKVIKIDDREIVVKELTVRQIWGFFNQSNGQTEGQDVPGGDTGRMLALACPDLPVDAAMDMAPSELEIIWKAFQEVNSVFLDLANSLGLAEMVKELVRSTVITSTRASAP